MAQGTQRLTEKALCLVRAHHMLPGDEGKVLCALSGGADSVCLFHWLICQGQRQGFSVTAAHFNHLLRGAESQRDEDFVKELVQRLGGGTIPLITAYADVARIAREEKRGVEEAARHLRYEFLHRAAQEAGAQVIATAHTADDNAETLLLHLVRGAGSGGLGGIPPKRDNIIRPLLTVSRREIEEYLLENGLSWVEDSSNADVAYNRNRIRHQVMPVLKEINPALLKGAYQTASILRQEHDYLEQLAHAAIVPAQWRGEELTLSAAHLAALPPALLPRAIQGLAEMLSPELVLSARQREDVTALVQGQSPSARLSLPGGLTVRREYELLILSRQPAPPPLAETVFSLPGEVRLGRFLIRGEAAVYQGEKQERYEFWLAQETAGAQLTLRARKQGDRLNLAGGGKSVKKLMIDGKIPRDARTVLPVFCRGELVTAVAGLGPDRAFLPAVGTRAWRITVRRQ